MYSNLNDTRHSENYASFVCVPPIFYISYDNPHIRFSLIAVVVVVVLMAAVMVFVVAVAVVAQTQAQVRYEIPVLIEALASSLCGRTMIGL